jgi:hypothetical protein
MMQEYAQDTVNEMLRLFSNLVLSLSDVTGKEINLPLPNSFWDHIDEIIECFTNTCIKCGLDYKFITSTNEVHVNGNIVRFIKLDMGGLA